MQAPDHDQRVRAVKYAFDALGELVDAFDALGAPLGAAIELETVGDTLALVHREGWIGYASWYVVRGDARTIRDTYGLLHASAAFVFDVRAPATAAHVIGVGDVTAALQVRARLLALAHDEHQTVVHAYAERIADGRVCLIDRGARWLVIPCAG